MSPPKPSRYSSRYLRAFRFVTTERGFDPEWDEYRPSRRPRPSWWQRLRAWLLGERW